MFLITLYCLLYLVVIENGQGMAHFKIETVLGRRIFLNGPTPASFSFIFGLFKQTLQFLQQKYVKKCPSSKRCRDSNPQPLEFESLPITTKPGLPPRRIFLIATIVTAEPRDQKKIAKCL